MPLRLARMSGALHQNTGSYRLLLPGLYDKHYKRGRYFRDTAIRVHQRSSFPVSLSKHCPSSLKLSKYLELASLQNKQKEET